jgi:hypothetical protein
MLLKKIYQHIIKGSWEIKKMYLTAFFYSLYIRFCMLFVRYKRYESTMGSRGKIISYIELSPIQFQQIKLVKTVVLANSKYTPWESKCMVQALSAKWLLKKYNIPSTIYFGVTKDEENLGKLKAHAWLKVNETFITGALGHKKFKVVNFYS